MRALVVCVALSISVSSVARAERAITLDADIRDAPRRLIRAHLVIPAQPGKLVLRYPKWIPGEHQPSGGIENLSRIALSAGGKRLPWTRDPVEMYAISVDVPKGANEITADVEYVLAEAGNYTNGPSSTEFLDILAWNKLVLYPDGKSTDDLRYRATLRVPAGWKVGTALPITKQHRDKIELAEVSLTTLVDSPVLSGQYTKVISLGSQVRLFMAADSEEALVIPDAVVQSYQRLVAEASALFGAHHYRAYTFLVALSDRIPATGIEHHESSDNRLPERAFADDKAGFNGRLFAHEYTHSWNGKYRRPLGLAPGRFDVPMEDELLWVYEGLTEYLSTVLAGRSGITDESLSRQALADYAGYMDVESGREWRSLADTAVSAQLLYGGPGWQSRMRGVAFYPEGALFWLEVDAILRAKSGGAKSLDDFCRAFYGGKDSGPQVATYQLADVIAALDAVATYDWKGLIDKRIYALRPSTPTESLAAAGWTYSYTSTLPARREVREQLAKAFDDLWSVGFGFDQTNTLYDVVAGSPADRAGLSPGMKLIAVDGRAFDPRRFREALARTKARAGMELIVQHADVFRTVKLDVSTGPRYPTLVRGRGADVLGQIFAPRVHR